MGQAAESHPSSFLVLESAIFEDLKATRSLRKVADSRLRLFSSDLSLVVCSVRAAYLVDAFVVPDPETFYGQFIERLRLKTPEFANVVHIFDTSSEQSFMLNVRMLRLVMASNSLCEPGRAVNWTSFVSLTDEPTLLPLPPAPVLKLLDWLIHATETSAANTLSLAPTIILPSGLTQTILVPLTAILLEYPVAYIPTSPTQTAFLAHIPLYVFDCVLVLAAPTSLFDPMGTDVLPRERPLLKFSYPCSIGKGDDGFSPAKLCERLLERFSGRVSACGMEGTTLRVEHRVETLDRVAM